MIRCAKERPDDSMSSETQGALGKFPKISPAVSSHDFTLNILDNFTGNQGREGWRVTGNRRTVILSSMCMCMCACVQVRVSACLCVHVHAYA
jgi:hypothetical protein